MKPLAEDVASRVRGGFAKAFHGLTWEYVALFALIVQFIALFHPSALAAYGISNARTVMPMGVEGIVKASVTMFLIFTPVFLAVVAADNLAPRKGTSHIAWLVAAALIGQAIGMVLFVLALPYLYPGGYFRLKVDPSPIVIFQQWRRIVGPGIRYFAISLVVTLLYYYLRRAAELAESVHREEMGREDVRRENAEARLQVMQAQIEPHFLFNTLASVRRLYQTDKAAGRAMMRHLSRYLTASLPSMRESRSTLERELALSLAYLGVQKIRMEGRLEFEVDVPPDLRTALLPPMMLATLVENAVIHGLGPLPDGGRIRISASAADDRLIVTVEDDGRGLQETDWGGGVGLANIRSRLHSAFGSAAGLKLAQRPGRGAVATLEVPMSPVEPVAA